MIEEIFKSNPEYRGEKLGRILVKMGKCTRDQVQEALAVQAQRAKSQARTPIGLIMVELGFIQESALAVALAAQAGMATVNVADIMISEAVLTILPEETARAYQVLPLSYDKESNTLTVALRNVNNFRAVDDLKLLMGFNVNAVLAAEESGDTMLDKNYGGEESADSLKGLMDDLASDPGLKAKVLRGETVDLDSEKAMADDNKVKRLLNMVLMQAIKDRASDIHFEPFEDEFKMRYRIDGVLYDMIPPPKHLALPIVSRVKVMSNLDIAERRLPQDGPIELKVAGSPVDLRVSVLPTVHGEAVVMRVLDRSAVSLDLDKLGMRHEDLNLIKQLIHKPHGVVIVTGPTGSGKTTTLYAALQFLNTVDTKIVTSEDPVEYDIDGLVQVPINNDVGLTFARALRSFLRMDPDIILVGETRDLETAQIAVQASLTGHLVFTTLHTNDAPSSIARLLDLGLEPFLVTATLEGIIAQRLVRKICSRCKEAYSPTEDQLSELQLTPDDLRGRQLYRGRGCDNCNGSGYKGRMGLYEIMVVDDDIRELIMHNASTQVLRSEALKRGMRTLRQSGLLSLFDGTTTIDEVVRETMIDD